jgi:hypothetical protein
MSSFLHWILILLVLATSVVVNLIFIFIDNLGRDDACLVFNLRPVIYGFGLALILATAKMVVSR